MNTAVKEQVKEAGDEGAELKFSWTGTEEAEPNWPTSAMLYVTGFPGYDTGVLREKESGLGSVFPTMLGVLLSTA